MYLSLQLFAALNMQRHLTFPERLKNIFHVLLYIRKADLRCIDLLHP